MPQFYRTCNNDDFVLSGMVQVESPVEDVNKFSFSSAFYISSGGVGFKSARKASESCIGILATIEIFVSSSSGGGVTSGATDAAGVLHGGAGVEVSGAGVLQITGYSVYGGGGASVDGGGGG